MLWTNLAYMKVLKLAQGYNDKLSERHLEVECANREKLAAAKCKATNSSYL